MWDKKWRKRGRTDFEREEESSVFGCRKQGKGQSLRRSALFRKMTCAALAVCVTVFLSGAGSAAADERKDEENSTTSQLYALSAVLMDADNGRVLLEKNGTEILPMASTTKIMTCIVALEQGNAEELAAVSAYAAGQPKVHLGALKGEYYKIEDLLYSLMLESHNDAAVIIAEHYGSKWAGLSEDCASHSVEESKRAVLAFTDRMNEKAKEIGCADTFFVTPNGLDGTLTFQEDGQEVAKEHSTTARDLARIMSYCITRSPARNAFLKVTQTEAYSFQNYKQAEGGFERGSRTVSCSNHNAFLQMMEGALSGKTGFTGKAGYCYVGALEREEKTFVVALLACGWPNHKTWKWHDTKLLMEYGLENYELRDISEERQLSPVAVENGQKDFAGLSAEAGKIELLLGPQDRVEVKWTIPERLTAPVRAGEAVGKEAYYVNGELYCSIPVRAVDDIPEITYLYCLKKIFQSVFL